MTTKFDVIKDELNKLVASQNPVLKYDMLSDALYWSDELPAGAADDPDRYWCVLQQVFRYRMTLLLNDPDRDLSPIWDHARALFPNWPGFVADRCRPNIELVRKYRDYHERAMDSFESISD